jgi:isoamylase
VLALRARQRRNFLATLLLSEGVPLLLAGDELGRTQAGNNNAYCQDNPISWVDWSPTETGEALTEFVASLSRFRHSHPALERRRFFAEGEIEWLRPDGRPMTDSDWNASFAHAVAVGSRDDALLLLINAWWESLDFAIPERFQGARHAVAVDTSAAVPPDPVGGEIRLPPRSLILVVRRE